MGAFTFGVSFLFFFFFIASKYPCCEDSDAQKDSV